MIPPTVAPVIAMSRHRIGTDGKGVTTLVVFHDCPLRCKYCINPFSFSPDTKFTLMTPEALYEETKIDALYYLATGGGVTFGGGEPLLRADFIQQFRKICGNEWHLCVETSLAVPWEAVETAASCIDHFYVDCKDMHPTVYQRYTGKSMDTMRQNLARLVETIPSERLTVRLPLIPDFNTETERDESRQILLNMGVTNIQELTYRIK